MRVKEANRFFFTQNPLELPKYYKNKNLGSNFSKDNNGATGSGNEGSASTMADENLPEGPVKVKDPKLYPEDSHEGF